MKLSRFLAVFFLWVFLHATMGSVSIVQIEDDNFLQERNPSPSFMCCSYETSEELQPTNLSDIRTVLGRSNSILNVNRIPHSKQGKVNYDRCTFCLFHPIRCALFVAMEKDSICFRMNMRWYAKRHVEQSSGKEVIQVPEKEEILTGNQTGDFKDINIPIGGGSRKKRSIQRRSLGPCGVPTSMSTASIACRSYPSRVVCYQRCAFGYTLENGIQQKLECSKKDGVWKPGKFKECKPFVDCTPSLSSGGSLSCSVKSVFESPACRISCLPYEDKEAVGEQTYVCNIDGKWDPPLPFCVTPGSGMLLVKAPQNKLHENVNKK